MNERAISCQLKTIQLRFDISHCDRHVSKLVATGMQAWCGKVVAYATCLSQMHQFTTAHCEKNWPDAKCMHVSIFKKRQLSFLLNNHFVSGIAFLSFYAK